MAKVVAVVFNDEERAGVLGGPLGVAVGASTGTMVGARSISLARA